MIELTKPVRAFVMVALVVGPAGMTTGQPRDPAWTAPPDAARRPNPLRERADAVTGGRKLFDQRCSTCHGVDGHGTLHAPDLTTARVQTQADGTLFWKITQGNTRTGMPTFSFLPELQRWQLVLHLRHVSNRSGSDYQRPSSSRPTGTRRH